MQVSVFSWGSFSGALCKAADNATDHDVPAAITVDTHLHPLVSKADAQTKSNVTKQACRGLVAKVALSHLCRLALSHCFLSVHQSMHHVY